MGDKVDVIKLDTTYGVNMWSQGIIQSIDDVSSSKGPTKEYRVKYLKDNVMPQAHETNTMAPFGSYTKDEGWRDTLKTGDRVDAIDRSEKKWHTATVIVPEERKQEDIMPIVKVGFRYYEKTGDKKDSMGEYFGLGEDKDDFIGAWTVRIQPVGTMCKLKDAQGNESPLKENKVICSSSSVGTATTTTTVGPDKGQDDKDMAMIKEEGQIIYVTERPATCKSLMFTEMVNAFGEAGGFDSMLKLISSPETTIRHVYFICDLLANCHQMFHKSFMDKWYPQLAEAVEQKIYKAKTRKEILDNDMIARIWKKVLTRLYQEQILSYKRSKIVLNLSIKLLKGEKFNEKLDGVKILNEECSQISKMSSDNTKDLLITVLKDEDILDLIFGKAIHTEFVSRTEHLLKLLMDQNAFPLDDKQRVWTACQDVDSTQIALYKVLVEAASGIKLPGQLSFFINQFLRK